jgi:hypothetical protein
MRIVPEMEWVKMPVLPQDSEDKAAQHKAQGKNEVALLHFTL